MSNMDVSVIIRLVDKLSGPAKEMEAAFKRLSNEAKALSKISGFDAMTRSLANSASQARRLESSIRSLEVVTRALTNDSHALQRNFGAVGRNNWITQQTAQMRQLVAAQRQFIAGQRVAGGGHGGGLGLGLGLGFGGNRAFHAASDALTTAAKLDTEKAMLELLGLPAEVRAKVLQRARDVSHLVPNLTQAEAIHRFRESRYAFAGTEHALDTLDIVAKSQALVARALSAEGGMNFGSEIMEMIKSGEVRGYVKDMDVMKRWMEISAQQAIATGGKVTPKSVFQALKYSRSGVFGYSNDFVNYILPELVQELSSGGKGGQGGAGTSLAAFKRMFVDQTVKKEVLAEWERLGLINEDKVVPNRHGASKLKLMPGAVVEGDLAVSNPFEWVNKVLVPRLQKSGVDTKDAVAVTRAVAKLGGTDLAKQLITLMILQNEQLEKRVDLMKKVMGLDAGYNRALDTYEGQVDALKKQWESTEQTVLAPLFPALKGLFGVLRGVLEWVEKFAAENPELSTAGLVAAGGFGALVASSVGLRMMLGGGLGYLLAGPLGAIIGGMTSLSTGASAAAAAVGTLTTALSVLALIVIGIAAGVAVDRWMKDHGLTGRLGKDLGYGPKKDENGKTLSDRLRDGTQKPMTEAVGDWANSLPFSWMWRSNAPAGPVRSFSLDDIQKAIGVPDLTPQGAQAGQSFVDGVMSVIRKLGTMTVPGPQIAPLAVPQSYQAPAAAPRAPTQVNANIHVHGVSDAHKVAHLVTERLQRAYEDHLSDGIYTT